MPRVKTRKFLIPLIAVVLAALFAVPAQAAGTYKILLTEAYEPLPKTLQAQVRAFPDVATVDLASTRGQPPTAAQLSSYDVVVSIGDSSYTEGLAWGNALADYYDQGGVVVQGGYDSWDNVGSFLEGRFTAGGYAPFIPGNNLNSETSLGAVKVDNPLMTGVTGLTTVDNTAPTLAPGAELVASWMTGKPAIAVKGRAVAITAWIGDEYGEVFSGDYGRVIVNAARSLGRQQLSVVNSEPAGGTVTSSAGGISCGAACGAKFPIRTPVSLQATPNQGFAFAGFSGDCLGPICAPTMDAPKAVSANFVAFELGKKAALNRKKGTAKLTVQVGGPGIVALAGKKVKKAVKQTVGGTLKMPVVAKGATRTALLAKGKAKVLVKVTYTPTGGSPVTVAKKLTLREALPK